MLTSYKVSFECANQSKSKQENFMKTYILAALTSIMIASPALAAEEIHLAAAIGGGSATKAEPATGSATGGETASGGTTGGGATGGGRTPPPRPPRPAPH